MPTPMSAYVVAAQKFGTVTPSDEQAVDKFFVDTFPSLPQKKQEQVLTFLLAHEGPARSVTSESAPEAPKAMVAFALTRATIVKKFAGKFFSNRLPRSFQPVSPPPAKQREHQWPA